MSDPLAALARDFDDVAQELADTTAPDRDSAELLADGIAREAPRASGYLAESVRPVEGEVLVEAVYGGVINDGWPARHITANPYVDRGIDDVDWPAPYVELVDDALDQLHRIYY